VSPNIVSPEYFRTFGIKLVQGRLFTDDDGADRPKVAVVSESMARFYFGDGEPLGRSFLLGSTDDPITIVGVVANVRHERLSEREPPKMVYTPLAQMATVTANGQNPVPTQVTVEVRTTGDPRALAPLLQSEVRRLNRVAVMSYVRTLEQQLDAALVRERLLAALSAGFSALALLLACVGVYGTLSHTVARRAREIGIRMALGAERRAVVGRVLRQCLTIAGCGVVLGGIVAIWMAGTLSAFLFEISPRDPLTLFATAGLLLVTAAAAGYLPARRAARVDPACVLKND
jgi:predicted permease